MAIYALERRCKLQSLSTGWPVIHGRVFLCSLSEVTCLVHASVQCRRYKNITAMFIWSGCITTIIIEKVYIDVACGSKTLAGVLLARFERVSHVAHL